MRFVLATGVIAMTTGIDTLQQLCGLVKTVTKSAFTGLPNKLRSLILPSRGMLELMSCIIRG